MARQAQEGTQEAREYINKGSFEARLAGFEDLSPEARQRIIKAVKLGLGIKDGATKAQRQEDKEGAEDQQETQRPSLSEAKDGDEYFKPEDCQVVKY